MNAKEFFADCLKAADNNRCCDCGAPEPQWASANLGLFICITCSGIHRNLGTHISRVKSLFLDNWTDDEMKVMREIGNAKGLALWEANLPSYYVKPAPEDSTPFKEQFIRAKYERKEFVDGTHKAPTGGMLFREGYLTKKGAVVKNWKKRWFVLRGSVLSYFKKPKDDEAAGEIIVTETTKCDAMNEMSVLDNHHFCFEIVTPTRTFYISAESARTMYEWIQSIRQAKQRLHILPFSTSAASTSSSSSNNASNVSNSPAATATAMPAPSSPRGPASPRAAEAANLSASACEELVSALRADNSFEIRKHAGRDKKLYKDVFLGIELVDWLILNKRAGSRKEAAAVGKALMDRGLLQCSSGIADFVDGRECYQIKK